VDPQTQEQKLHILLALDGSDHAQAATLLVANLPLPQGSQVTAAAVLQPRDASDHANLEGVLEQARPRLALKGWQVHTELLVGSPAEVLIDYADRIKANLIILGAKGRRAALGILVGGVAQQLVEYAHWPVLIVRAPYTGLRRVVVLTDGSIHSQHALDFLARFPLAPALDLRALHVLPPLISPAVLARSWPVGTELIPAAPDYEAERQLVKQAEEEEFAGRQLLARSVERLRGQGVSATAVLLRGDAAAEVIEYARANQVDLIVCGSRGLSRMKGLLLGSLSRKLVHYAGRSVLVVKGSPAG
jgi:nucleotide-binding universal stress UspA family protein